MTKLNVQIENVISLDSLYQKLDRFGLDRRSHSFQEISGKGYTHSSIRRDCLKEIYAWCQENFGNDWTWSSPAHLDHTTIFFINPDDCLLFNIRWGDQLYTKPVDA